MLTKFAVLVLLATPDGGDSRTEPPRALALGWAATVARARATFPELTARTENASEAVETWCMKDRGTTCLDFKRGALGRIRMLHPYDRGDLLALFQATFGPAQDVEPTVEAVAYVWHTPAATIRLVQTVPAAQGLYGVSGIVMKEIDYEPPRQRGPTSRSP